METVIQINDAINQFAWGTVSVVLLMGTGLICSLVTGFPQFSRISHWFKNTFGICTATVMVILRDKGYRVFVWNYCF